MTGAVHKKFINITFKMIRQKWLTNGLLKLNNICISKEMNTDTKSIRIFAVYSASEVVMVAHSCDV